MPARSAVLQLPKEIREDLDRRLVAGGFAGYESLSDWLAGQGFQISKSSLHRYGEKFEERAAALKMASEQAKAIVAESPDDEGAMSEALMRLVQEKVFNILLDMEVDPKNVSISGLTRSVAELARATVTQKKYAAEVREKVKATAEAVAKIARKGGLSAESAAAIRSQILGIAS